MKDLLNKQSFISVKRLSLINRYYKITRFYSFLKSTAIKAAITIVAFLLIFFLLEYFLLDFDTILNSLVQKYEPPVVFGLFLTSETFFGLLPPEFFIAWSAKAAHPLFYLFMLALMSYIGGVFAYFIGKLLFIIPKIRHKIHIQLADHIDKLKKWGGLFVFIGAMLPVPHSIVSMACGLINYNFKNYLWWALFRFVRFALYATVIFKIF